MSLLNRALAAYQDRVPENWQFNIEFFVFTPALLTVVLLITR